MCNHNLQILPEEYSIFWFDLCGWKFTEDRDNDTGSSDKITTPVAIGHRQDRKNTVTTAYNGAACSKSPPRLIP